jgi:RimJ/RimL family protein N-acetyltransferase
MAGWDLQPRLCGELVTLEPLTAAHADALFSVARHEEIWAWWPFNPALDQETFTTWVKNAIEATRSFHFATFDSRTGAPLGSTSFCTPRPDDRGIEIGWTWLTPSAWGSGANTEAKLLGLRHAFEVLDCIRVEFETDEQNVRSRRALEALPAQFEGVWRDWRIVDGGQRRSSAYYSILDSEWPHARARLSERVQTVAALRNRSRTEP